MGQQGEKDINPADDACLFTNLQNDLITRDNSGLWPGQLLMQNYACYSRYQEASERPDYRQNFLASSTGFSRHED